MDSRCINIKLWEYDVDIKHKFIYRNGKFITNFDDICYMCTLRPLTFSRVYINNIWALNIWLRTNMLDNCKLMIKNGDSIEEKDIASIIDYGNIVRNMTDSEEASINLGLNNLDIVVTGNQTCHIIAMLE